MNDNIYRYINDLSDRHFKLALCTIVKTKGSTPLKSGAQLLVLEDGSSVGTIGGGALEMAVIKDALQCIQEEKNQLYEHHLTKDYQMCCGGTVWVFIQVILPLPELLIVGAGHIGQSLVELSAKCDFNITLIDNRKERIELLSRSMSKRNINYLYSSDIEEYIRNYDKNVLQTYCVIATYNHQLDKNVLLCAVQKNFKYVGMIGSRRKVLSTVQFLKEHFISDDKINCIDMPIGLDINAQSPQEIAVSILGKIIQVKNQHYRKQNNIENIELCQIKQLL